MIYFLYFFHVHVLTCPSNLYRVFHKLKYIRIINKWAVFCSKTKSTESATEIFVHNFEMLKSQLSSKLQIVISKLTQLDKVSYTI